MKEAKKISSFDAALAHFLLKTCPQSSEEEACFLCHLSLAAKKGHLCIEANDLNLTPPVAELWAGEEDGELLTDTEIDLLTGSILKGAQTLSEKNFPFIRHEEGRFYFPKFWFKENELTEALKKIYRTPPAIEIDNEKICHEISQLLEIKTVLPEQAEGLHCAIKQSFTMICGGPGTGKTYTAAILIKMILNLLTTQQKADFEVVLAAPTGKAAANLQKSLSASLATLAASGPVKAQTLHSLLGIRQKRKSLGSSYLNADLLVVDESSMIDIELMLALLKKVKPGARLILLGDPDQLPSVEAGTVFSDFIQSRTVQPVYLKKCLRAELQEIVDFSKVIQSGEFDKAIPFFSRGIKRNEIGDDIKWDLLNQAAPHFEIDSTDPMEILEAFNRFRILSPLRRGPFGVDAINQWFAKNPKKAAPITITRSKSDIELFNGETGVLIKKDFTIPYFEEGDCAYFPGNQPGTYKQIPAVLLPPFEYGYCLSVHKSQGSEFDHVLFLLPEKSEVFGKQVLYTGVTRAKKTLEIWGSLETLKKTMKTETRRLSGIPQKLAKMNSLDR